MKQPKRITINAIINDGNIILIYMLGNWKFLTYYVASKTISASFKLPKFAQNDSLIEGENNTQYIDISRIGNLPSKSQALTAYHLLKQNFDESIAEQRIAYYQAKIDKVKRDIQSPVAVSHL